MSKNTVRQPGQCTECGNEATHANECVMCHCATLSLAVIKNIFPASNIRSVTENLCDADLIEDAKDVRAPENVRRVAKTITSLAFAHRINHHDLKRRIVSRLRDTCAALDAETEASRQDYNSRITEWLKQVSTKLCK